MAAIKAILATVMVVLAVICFRRYRTEPALVGKLGIWIIALGAFSFSMEIIVFAFSRSAVEQAVLIPVAVSIPPFIALYWIRVWNRKRPDRKKQNEEGA